MNRPPPIPLRTYSHLAARRKVPTEYEVVTTGLLYYAGRGFEVNVPLESWYARYQTGSPLGGVDWEGFADPGETTYARYTAGRARREAHVDGTLRAMSETGYDGALGSEWLATLGRLLPPLRFAFHGLQMAAAYLGQMAPGGRITVVAAFQAADELRRVHRIAYRTAQLARQRPGFGGDARARWTGDAAWQPLRRLIETALVAYDWGECFVVLNLCMKPRLDALMLEELARAARAGGDPLLAEVLFSFSEDAEWHRTWSRELVRIAVAGRPENADVIARWVHAWTPAVRAAVEAWARLLPHAADASRRVEAAADDWLRALPLARIDEGRGPGAGQPAVAGGMR